MAKKMGFVGVGRMGANMARRLNDCGYKIASVYDVNRNTAESVAKELGATGGVTCRWTRHSAVWS